MDVKQLYGLFLLRYLNTQTLSNRRYHRQKCGTLDVIDIPRMLTDKTWYLTLRTTDQLKQGEIETLLCLYLNSDKVSLFKDILNPENCYLADRITKEMLQHINGEIPAPQISYKVAEQISQTLTAMGVLTDFVYRDGKVFKTLTAKQLIDFGWCKIKKSW